MKQFSGKAFLAPIDGYTNLPFRLLCQKHGADFTTVPLINSIAIARTPSRVAALIDANKKEKSVGLQLVGSNPEDFVKATKTIDSAFPSLKFFNLNCGCPSERTRDSGGGSALLSRPELVTKILDSMRANTNKPISAKIRLKNSTKDSISFAKTISCHCDFLIVHGRTVKQKYSGECDWNAIKEIKEHIEIPLIGNGDIRSLAQGRDLIKNNFCDSFMIARAAMSNPLVFEGKIPSNRQKLELFSDYLKISRQTKILEIAGLRLKAMQFLKGAEGSAKLRLKISRAKTLGELEKLVSESSHLIIKSES
ncbi:tRNA-dihydrouridine synthase B [Candidatus Gugararchaeum adminiculabundum]|nr:tRNA-dihydrouridine synthase B [Candidatus Gugararchaeum adminiculabundum]